MLCINQGSCRFVVFLLVILVGNWQHTFCEFNSVLASSDLNKEKFDLITR